MPPATLPHRRLGRSELTVSCLGLGCMGMSYAYGPADEAENMRVLHRYVERGGNFLDSAEIYGPYTNEELLGRLLQEVGRERVVLATKFGFKLNDKGVITGVDSSPANVRRVCEASLKRLQVDVIDLFYQHRVDPRTPIEDTVGAMAELVREGKVRALGLSEAGADTIRRAVAVHPIAALQSEFSLWSRDIATGGILDTCRELGVGFVPYSPLGRGFLTGAIQKVSDLDASDWRRTNPRFQEEALQQNLKLAAEVKTLAEKKGCSPAQLALAWVLAQGDDVVPIPGTKRLKYLEDNLGAVDVKLDADDLREIEAACERVEIVGQRYPAGMMSMLNR